MGMRIAVVDPVTVHNKPGREINMAKEVKATENQEIPAAPAEEAPASSVKKTKKINRMSLKELTSKIEAIDNGKTAGSKYYKHLLQRKAELETPRQS